MKNLWHFRCASQGDPAFRGPACEVQVWDGDEQPTGPEDSGARPQHSVIRQ